MSRMIRALAFAGVLALVAAGSAFAAGASKVTGGNAQLTLSSAAAGVLATNHVAVAPLAPATASGSTLTLPITGGRLNTTTLHGVIRTGGGFTLSTASRKAVVRGVTFISTKKGVSIDALVRGREFRYCTFHGRRHHRFRRCVTIVRWNLERVATVSGVTTTSTSASGTVDLSARGAELINRVAGKQIATAGEPIGTATVTPTVA